MQQPERRARLIRAARLRGDRAAELILTADRPYRDEPDRALDRVWAGLRWSPSSLEAAWWPRRAA